LEVCFLFISKTKGKKKSQKNQASPNHGREYGHSTKMHRKATTTLGLRFHALLGHHSTSATAKPL